jgi:hypothetical protein
VNVERRDALREEREEILRLLGRGPERHHDPERRQEHRALLRRQLDDIDAELCRIETCGWLKVVAP